MDIPAPPALVPTLVPMARLHVEVGPVLSLGAAPLGERRCVAITGGRVEGPELSGSVVPGGADWQWLRADGAIELAAHYIVRTADGALVEVRSEGLRHGPPEVMARLAAGEAVAPGAYWFRTLVRLTTGAAAWAHLNRVLAVAAGTREAACVRLDIYRVT